MQMRRIGIAAVVVLLLSVGVLFAAAEREAVPFPQERGIRMAVPYGAGGGVDISARILASVAPEFVGQRIDIVAMPGAGGQEAINFVLQQPKDGYTLLITDYGPLVTTALTEQVNYELEDWVPIFQITEVQPIFFVRADSPIETVEDWITMAKEEPGRFAVGHGRHLSVPHLPLILFEQEAGIENTHIPTTGGAEALAFILGGQTDIGASVPSTIAGAVASGDVRALAVASPARSQVLPNVPTLQELGYDVMLPAWYTIFAHKDVPVDRMKYLEEKFMEGMLSASAKAMADRTRVELTLYGMEETAVFYQNTVESLKSLLEFIGE